MFRKIKHLVKTRANQHGFLSREAASPSRISTRANLDNSRESPYVGEEPKQPTDRDMAYTVTIDDLPPELLSYIFVQALDGDPVRVWEGDRPEVPWTLTLVCSRWRHITLAEPHLWNNLSIFSSLSVPVSLVRFWHKVLARCQRASLSLDIALPSDDGTDLTTLVAPYLQRVRKLSVCLVIGHFPTFMNQSLDALESITLIVRQNSTSRFIQLRQPILTNAPNLRRVAISNQGKHYLSSNDFKLPWAQLTDLKIRSNARPYPGLLLVIQHCPRLITLDLIQDNEQDLEDQIVPEVRLPHLRLLRVDDLNDNRFCTLLDHLVLPSLTGLFLPGSLKGRHLGSVESLIERSQCTLDILSITASAFSSDAFYHMAKMLPELRELRVLSFAVPVQLVLPIIQGKELPTVQYFTCSVMWHSELYIYLEDTSKGLETGRSCWKGPSHVDFWGYPGDDDAAFRLEQRFAKFGLKIHMSGGLDTLCNRD